MRYTDANTGFVDITITFTNNTQQSFKVPKQGDISTLAKRFDEFRQYDHMAIQTKDHKLILVPFNNVLRLDIEPFPDVYAKSMIHGAIPI